MSISTSPTSEARADGRGRRTAVLGVFGHNLWLVAGDAVRTRLLPEGADLIAAVLQFVADGERPGALDLIYQPADLQVLAAECAQVSRAKLHAYFAGEYRELAHPATLWGCTPPQPHLDGKFTTLLHYEQRPRLEHLLQLCEAGGSRVRAVFPPAAALAERTRTQQLELALLLAGGAGLFYYVNELGIPTVRFLRSWDALPEHLGVALASRTRPPVRSLIVADPGSVPAEVEALLQEQDLMPEREAWADFLRSVDLPPRSGANLALRPFKWKRAHSLVAATVVLAGLTGFLAYDTGRLWWGAKGRAAESARRRQQLEREVASLVQIEQRYRQTEALLAAVPVGNPRPSVLLEAVTQALPPTLQVQTFRYQGGPFTLEGVAHEPAAADKGPYPQLIEALGGPSRPWTLKPAKPAAGAMQWTLSGTLQP